MLTMYRNGRIHSPAHPAPTALAVEDGTVTWVGDEADAVAHVGVRVVDLDGAFVAPAFVDAHVHATATGLGLVGLDLRSARSLGEALAAVEQAARSARGRPILGGGWDESQWPEQRPPTAAELDRAAYGGAVYLARVDVHSAVVSSAVMATVPGLSNLAGYDPHGWQHEPAHDAVRVAALGALTTAQRRDAQRAALRQAAALGIACVHEMAGPIISSEDDLTALLALAAAEPLPEVIGYWAQLHGIDAARDLGAIGAAGDLFIDGSLGSHTAALHAPYTDRPDTAGLLRYDTAELAEHIVECAATGLQAGFHAIGDAAVDQLLDAVDLAGERLGGAGGAGHRIEHAEYVPDPVRLAASGLFASMQPCFDALWGGAEGLYAERLGADRAPWLNRFADLAGAGVPLAFGSDTPVTEAGPWAAVRAAVHPHDPTAGIDVATAFSAHTVGGWRAAGRTAEGVLVPGAPATLAVWETPDGGGAALPDVAPGAELPTCLATLRRGEVIFDRGLLG